MNGLFTAPGASNPRLSVLGRFAVGPTSYGFKPTVPGRRTGVSWTPAISGLFRSGRVVPGISQINAMATNVPQGSG